MRATRSVGQSFGDERLEGILLQCQTMTYNAIHYAQENGISNRKGMGDFHRSLKSVPLPSCYKRAAITRACAVLKSREKGDKRSVQVRHPKPLRLTVCIISGFFTTAKGRLFIPLTRDKYIDVQLNDYVQETLEGKKVRSLTITPSALSFHFSEEIEPNQIHSVFGVDRNEKNLTFGNAEKVAQIDLSETVRIRKTTRSVLGSFKRNDVRIRRKLARKYWKRADHRIGQTLHATTNFIVGCAAEEGSSLALENLTNIRKMYRKGSGQGADYRFRLNSWPYQKAYWMLEYKSAWKGVTMIPLTRSETYGSSSVHSACGEKLRRPEKGDAMHSRMLWCEACKTWTDRDVNAAVVLSQRGLARFASSLPRSEGRSQQAPWTGEKGLAGEAVRGNPTPTAILRVDASKLTPHPMVNVPIGHSQS